ncbi:MAG: biopolymer transporter ExbD [Candidatus Omnitrophica bacterium]|nr:biopolymer transporter ExbD [Candidatus Omnitrophota bacterium]
MNISVPHAKHSTDMVRLPGEIILNVRSDGSVVVNQRELSYEELGAMLNRISGLYPNQPIIIRGDQETKHKFIIKILDLCAGAKIWNISFMTMPIEEGKKK